MHITIVLAEKCFWVWQMESNALTWYYCVPIVRLLKIIFISLWKAFIHFHSFGFFGCLVMNCSTTTAKFCRPSVLFFTVACLLFWNVSHIKMRQHTHHMHCKCFPWSFSDQSEQLCLVAVNEVVDHCEQHPVEEYSHAFCRHEAEPFHFHYLHGNNLRLCQYLIISFVAPQLPFTRRGATTYDTLALDGFLWAIWGEREHWNLSSNDYWQKLSMACHILVVHETVHPASHFTTEQLTSRDIVVAHFLSH